MTRTVFPGFTPYPGFDPLDGDDPRVILSADNPCRSLHHTSNNRPQDLSDASGRGMSGVDHGTLINSTEQRNNG